MKVNRERFLEIVAEVAKKRRDYDRAKQVDQIESSWKTDKEYKKYDKKWNDSWHSDGQDEAESDLVELEQVLEQVAPKITYLQVQKLLRTLLEKDSVRVSDYYNRYYLNLKLIKASKLWDYLEAEKLISV